MRNNKFYKAIILGFLFSTFSLFSPYIIEENYVNKGSWNIYVQWGFLWAWSSTIIFLFDRVFKKIEDAKR